MMTSSLYGYSSKRANINETVYHSPVFCVDLLKQGHKSALSCRNAIVRGGENLDYSLSNMLGKTSMIMFETVSIKRKRLEDFVVLGWLYLTVHIDDIFSDRGNNRRRKNHRKKETRREETTTTTTTTEDEVKIWEDSFCPLIYSVLLAGLWHSRTNFTFWWL